MKIKTYANKIIEIDLNDLSENSNLLALPALIVPHVHFRVPGAEHKEDWQTGARAAVAGGYTTVIDMPNNNPPVINYAGLMEKKKIINEQLKRSGLPLNYALYLGATKNNWTEFEKCAQQIAGIKLFMGASTGNLLVDKKEDQEKIFAEAARLNLLVAVHAEDEATINNNKQGLFHSVIRSREAAIKAVSQALELAKKYKTKLYLCHISTAEEINLVAEAKKEGVTVYAEVTPHHLFLNENDYDRLGTLGQVNPPLRTIKDNQALWQAINDGLIDIIGTDHAPHTLKEKAKPYPNSPSGVPGIETCLSLLLNACHESKITLNKIVELTHDNPQKIFNLPKNNDLVIVDLDLKKEVKNENLKTKCGWSPFVGRALTGWPVAVIINNKIKKL
mgnify:FL=1